MKCSPNVMGDNLLKRIEHIACAVLPGAIRTKALGENYYSFQLKDSAGNASTLPHIWIDPASTDQQIRKKLIHAVDEALHPESAPDDLSVPNLKGEEAGT